MNTIKHSPAYTLNGRTWFGVRATVQVPPGLFHRAGYGRLLIDHPGLVNCLLRAGLAEDVRCRLVAQHEWGHLQSFPLEMLYALVLFGIAIGNGNHAPGSLALVLISCFAAWEIFAEAYIVVFERHLYHRSYREISRLPRGVFWLLAILLSMMGWSVALH